MNLHGAGSWVRDAEDQSGPLDWMCSVVDKSSSLHVKINPRGTTWERPEWFWMELIAPPHLTPQDIHPQFNKSGYWIVFLDYLSSFPMHATECLAHSLLIFSAGFVWLSISHGGWVRNHCRSYILIVFRRIRGIHSLPQALNLPMNITSSAFPSDHPSLCLQRTDWCVYYNIEYYRRKC